MTEPTVKACPICGREALHNCWHERLGRGSRVITFEMTLSKALRLARQHLAEREETLADDRLQVARYESKLAEYKGQQAIDQLAAIFEGLGDTKMLNELRRICVERGLGIATEAAP